MHAPEQARHWQKLQQPQVQQQASYQQLAEHPALAPATNHIPA
jgi:hypothetical protein